MKVPIEILRASEQLNVPDRLLPSSGIILDLILSISVHAGSAVEANESSKSYCHVNQCMTPQTPC